MNKTSIIKTSIGRRSFIRSTALAGGGMMLGFSWLASCKFDSEEEIMKLPEEWFELNSYLKIGENGVATIYTPNPEFGQNVRTSMPMLIAEELDMDWNKVIVEQAPYHPEKYGFQFTGGSQGIRSRWKPLRMVGATARQMLMEAAASAWQVPVSEIKTDNGMLIHEASNRSAGYGEMASAAAKITVPDEVEIKNVTDFKIIGKSTKNVDAKDIVTGKPIFGLDYSADGMLVAMIVHPPAFGLTLKSFDAETAKAMPGIRDVFAIKSYKEDFQKGGFDTNAFPEVVAIVGNTTWEVMQAKKEIVIDWDPINSYSETINGFRGQQTINVPAGLESTEKHTIKMMELASRKGEVVRRDGSPEKIFENASKILERSYSAPYLAHNSMEPLTAFAHVQG
ncbi:MAG: xanthine dehydrogenase family protein molybdopterin-binding subunit, partial [Flavobacteriaceae bacterium]|nr:xanthine dehydrogenase family protein molybdopterin-binding subunit [Flavobacteriaceae bacterium]